MSLSPRDLQTLIASACGALRTHVNDKVVRHDAECHKARVKNEDPPAPDLPRASVPRWVSWAAAELADAEYGAHHMPVWMRDSDVVAGHDDLAGPALDRLRDMAEFRAIATEVIEIRWTRRPIVRRDVMGSESRCGRVKAVPVGDRLAWTGEGDAPSFRLELSLPWFLLAEPDEIDRGLHELLAACWVDDDKPVIRKPDIVAHASTLARFGVSGVREAHAVFCAQRHPAHERTLRDFGFDAVTGQGSLWSPVAPRQADLRDGGGRLAGQSRLGAVEAIEDPPEA